MVAVSPTTSYAEEYWSPAFIGRRALVLVCRGKYRTILVVLYYAFWLVWAALLSLEVHQSVSSARLTGVARLTLHLAQETSCTTSLQSI